LRRAVQIVVVLALVVGAWAYVQRRGFQAPKNYNVESSLRELLAAQADAWNRGDIEGFMAGYWKSDQLSFSGTNGVTRGWQGLDDRYHRVYPNRAAMGHLAFSDLEITPLGPDAAMILGRWRLDREADHPGGVFTLIARRFPEGWRIIHDHTSADAPPVSVPAPTSKH